MPRYSFNEKSAVCLASQVLRRLRRPPRQRGNIPNSPRLPTESGASAASEARHLLMIHHLRPVTRVWKVSSQIQPLGTRHEADVHRDEGRPPPLSSPGVESLQKAWLLLSASPPPSPAHATRDAKMENKQDPTCISIWNLAFKPTKTARWPARTPIPRSGGGEGGGIACLFSCSFRDCTTRSTSSARSVAVRLRRPCMRRALGWWSLVVQPRGRRGVDWEKRRSRVVTMNGT